MSVEITDIFYNDGMLMLMPPEAVGTEIWVHNEPDMFKAEKYISDRVDNMGFSRVYNKQFNGLFKINIEYGHNFSVAVKRVDGRYFVKRFGKFNGSEIMNYTKIWYNEVTSVLTAEFSSAYDGLYAYLFASKEMRNYSKQDMLRLEEGMAINSDVLSPDFIYIGKSKIENGKVNFNLSNQNKWVVSVFMVSHPPKDDNA